MNECEKINAILINPDWPAAKQRQTGFWNLWQPKPLKRNRPRAMQSKQAYNKRHRQHLRRMRDMQWKKDMGLWKNPFKIPEGNYPSHQGEVFKNVSNKN